MTMRGSTLDMEALNQSIFDSRIIDIGVLTIIPCEIEAMFSTFDIPKVNVRNGSFGLNYWKTSIYSQINGRNINIVVTFLGGSAGNTEAGIATATFFRHWHPRLMCLTGIAAGVKGKVCIGDVVIPDKVHDVCASVLTDDEELPRDNTRYREQTINKLIKLNPISTKNLNAKILSNVPGIANFKHVAKAVGLETGEYGHEFVTHDGSLISSNSLLKNSDYFAKVRKTKDEKCRCGEMEAAGFTMACDIEKIPWIITRGISDFGDHRKDDLFHTVAAYNAAIALREILENIMIIDSLPERRSETYSHSVFETNILNDLVNGYKKKRWRQVVLNGRFISRPLFIAGKYEIRRAIGEIVEDAAFRVRDTEARISALIDDIGWTSYVMGDAARAVKSIEDGLLQAERCKYHYMISKGRRHLASICRQNREFEEALENIELASTAAKKIKNAAEREEMNSSIMLSKAKLLISSGRCDEACKLLIEARTRFQGANDFGRVVKTFAPLGRAYRYLGKISSAKTEFENGYENAYQLGRNDEMFNNAIELANEFEESNDYEKAVYWLHSAAFHANELNNIEKSAEIARRISRLEARYGKI